MKVVYKYPLNFGKNIIRVKQYSKVLKAAVRPDGMMYIWIESIFIGQVNEDRIFYIYGTGDSIPENLSHVDTFFEGEYVWHVYEEIHETTK